MKKSTCIILIFICITLLFFIKKQFLFSPVENTNFALLYGPFRGIINVGIEWKMLEEQKKGNAFEVIQLGQWMAEMQPNNPKIWEYLAWNMGYNMLTYFPDPEIRWEHLRRSLRFLLEDGLKYMPDNSILLASAGEIIYDKIAGGLPDPYSPYFREKFAKEITYFMPTGSIADLRAFTDSRGIITDSGRDFKTVFHLDFLRMEKVDSEFGPFDWRQPYALLIYYKTKGDFKSFSDSPFTHNLNTYLAWRWACENGRLLLNPLKYSYISSFDIRLADKIHDYLEHQQTMQNSELLGDQHNEFVKGAAAMLFVNNKIDSARNYYEHYVEEMKDKQHPSFNDFIEESTNLLLNSERVFTQKSVVETALLQALLAQRTGDEQLAIGYFKLGRLLWENNQEKNANSPAKRLPPFDKMLETAKLLRDEILHEIPIQE